MEETKDVKKVDVEELAKLPTHAIRDFGRSMGVKSPTTKTNKKIAEEVGLILEGKLEPYFSVTGRKAKQSTTNQIFENFTKQFSQQGNVHNDDLNELNYYKKQNAELVLKLYNLRDEINNIINLLTTK